VPFYYVMVVWGDKYVDILLDVALPCLLAPGNLPALTNLRESRFVIMTTPRDRERIAASSIFMSLSSIIRPEFVEAAWFEEDLSYYLKASRGHQEAAKIAAQHGAYCVYLVPDMLMSNGALHFLLKMASAGKQAVMVPGIRVVRETILEEIKSALPSQPHGVLNIGPRELVALGLRHVHICDQRYNWDHPSFSMSPVVCTWNIPGEHGLLVRAFHLHPILMKINNVDSIKLLDSNTIDDEFLGLNFPNWDAIHIETDSDNIVLFSLTDRDDRNKPLEPNVANVEKLREVAYSDLTNPLHRYYFTKAIKLHSRELNEKWTQVEKDTGLLAYSALCIRGTGRPTRRHASEFLPYINGRALLRELVLRVKSRLHRLLRKPP
jgi:hypothetical protein